MLSQTNSLITFNISDKKKKMLKKRAKILGIDVSTLLRDLIDDYLDMKKKNDNPWEKLIELHHTNPQLAKEFGDALDEFSRSKDSKELPSFE